MITVIQVGAPFHSLPLPREKKKILKKEKKYHHPQPEGRKTRPAGETLTPHLKAPSNRRSNLMQLTTPYGDLAQ